MGGTPEREAYSDTILTARLRAAVTRLNPQIPEDAREDALRKLPGIERPSLIEENRRLHRAMVEGVPVEYRAEDGTIRGDAVRLIDPADRQNDWLAIAQFTVIENGNNRRPDVVVFLNGLPVGVIEVKKPGAETATLGAAFNQLQTCKAQIGSLFRANAVLVTTDGIQARIGSLTADLERFMPWRTTDGAAVAPKGAPEMSVLIEGVFARPRLLSLLRDFTVFGDTPGGIAKIIAGYHQFHAVKRAVVSTVEASRSQGDRKAGVIWHTQGSGKSLLMAFYAGQLVREPAMENPTIVVITDRNDLDDVNTPAVFGHYIDVYDISRAVEDGATVPIYYESRLARIELPEEEKPRIDAEIEELTEDEAVSEQERLKRKWSTVEALVGSGKRLAAVCSQSESD